MGQTSTGVDCLGACGVGYCGAVDGALIQKVEVGLAHAQACAARVVSSGVGIGRAVDFAVCGGGVPLEVVDAHADVGGPWSQSLREGLARAEVGALGLREGGDVDQDIDDHLSVADIMPDHCAPLAIVRDIELESSRLAGSNQVGRRRKDRGAWSEDCNWESGPVVVKFCPANILGSELFYGNSCPYRNRCIIISKNDLAIDLDDEFEVSGSVRK